MNVSLDQPPIMQSRLSWRILLGLLLTITIVQVLLYSESFHVKPSGDDFSGLTTDIHRAEMEGPASLFRATNQPKNYRPMQSLFMWLAARWTMPDPWVAVHLLHFGSMLVFGLTMLGWLRVMPVSSIAAAVAVLVCYIHPVITPQLATIDGFSGLLAGAMTWLGALAVYCYRERPLRASVSALICLVFGSLFKEYCFGLVPLALLAAVVFPSRRKIALIASLFVALMIGMIGLMWVRQVTVMPGYIAEVPRPELNPTQIAKNMALFAAVIVYYGHTAWVYVNRDALALSAFAVSALITVGLLSMGLFHRVRSARTVAINTPGPQDAPLSTSPIRWIVFLLLSFGPVSFPANLLPHVSEMYAGVLVMPFALLAGLATDGILSLQRPLIRVGAAMLIVAQLTLGAVAIRQKVSELRDVGDRADRMARQLDAAVPQGVHDEMIGLVFLTQQIPTSRQYSIYRMKDPILLLGGEGLPWVGVLEWLRPGKRIHFDPLIVGSVQEVDRRQYPLLYLWDAEAQTVTPVPRTMPR